MCVLLFSVCNAYVCSGFVTDLERISFVLEPDPERVLF